MNTLSFFGIYPDSIERADKICQKILKHANFNDNEISELYDGIYDEFYNYMDYAEFKTVTNALIFCMFYNTKNEIKKKYPDLDIDIYVNGLDSHMYIDGVNADEYEFEKEND